MAQDSKIEWTHHTANQMSTKERVVRESIRQAEAEREELQKLIQTNPYGQILRLEEDAIKRAQSLSRQRKTELALAVLAAAQKEKDALLLIVEKQKRTPELIERVVQLDSELSELNMELYHIERDKERRKAFSNDFN